MPQCTGLTSPAHRLLLWTQAIDSHPWAKLTDVSFHPGLVAGKPASVIVRARVDTLIRPNRTHRQWSVKGRHSRMLRSFFS